MTLATQLHRLSIAAVALGLAVTPLASPLLLALALLAGGMLLAYRSAADLFPAGPHPIDGETVFRHQP